MNKYRVIITNNKGKRDKRFEKTYEVPDSTLVIDYLLHDSSLVYDLQNSEIDINDIKLEIYLESPLAIEGHQESIIRELQEVVLEKTLNFDYLKAAIFNSLNEIGLTYEQEEEPLPTGIKKLLLKLLSNKL